MNLLILLKKRAGGVGRYVMEIKNILEKRNIIVDVIYREDDLGINSFFKSIIPLRQYVRNYDYDIFLSPK